MGLVRNTAPISWASLSQRESDTPMKIQFECTCGADISEFTRGEGPDTDVRVVCGNCESMYVVTITQLLDGSEW